VKLGGDADLHDIALATSGATGADLANMVNEGALLAVKENRNAVTQKDLMVRWNWSSPARRKKTV